MQMSSNSWTAYLGHFTDITSQHVFNLLLLETTFDNQTACAIDGTSCTHLREKILNNVVGWPSHTFADIGNICEDTLLAFTVDDGGWNSVTFASSAE